VVVAALGAGTAAACDHGGSAYKPHHGVKAAQFAKHHGFMHHRGSLLALPATYLGTSTDALKDQLKSGKSLAQIANATPGKSAQGLVDYLVAQAKTKLDAKVAAGKLTSAQENAWLDKLTDWVTAAVDRSWHR
jgi:hypothetical protein